MLMEKTEAQNKFFSEDKQYYSIGEASNIVGVKQFVLRFWETEFPSVKPVKSRANRRLYRRTDIEKLLQIKHLLYEEKYTIPGAKKKLAEDAHSNQMDLTFLKRRPEELLTDIRKELIETLTILDEKKPENSTPQ